MQAGYWIGRGERVAYVTKEEIQMPELWVRDRNLWGTWFHGAAHWSHVLSWLQEYCTSCGGWSDRWCCTKLQLSCGKALPKMRFWQDSQVGHAHLPKMRWQDATHWRRRILDIVCQTCFSIHAIRTATAYCCFAWVAVSVRSLKWQPDNSSKDWWCWRSRRGDRPESGCQELYSASYRRQSMEPARSSR